MEINTHEHIVRIQIIGVTGRLEAFTVAKFREEQDRLLAEGHARFVIDLRETEFMDSAGMSALVTLLKRARQQGGNVVLVKPTDPAAYRILTLTRFDQVFTMADTPEGAIQQFSS